MLQITAGFTVAGEIIGAIVHHDTKRDAIRAKNAIRKEIAPRHESTIDNYETVSLESWLDHGQLLEVDVGLDIVKG